MKNNKIETYMLLGLMFLVCAGYQKINNKI